MVVKTSGIVGKPRVLPQTLYFQDFAHTMHACSAIFWSAAGALLGRDDYRYQLMMDFHISTILYIDPTDLLKELATAHTISRPSVHPSFFLPNATACHRHRQRINSRDTQSCSGVDGGPAIETG